MKKICLMLALSAIAFSAPAQLYFRAGIGYAMPQAGQSMYDTPIPYNGFPTGYNGTRNNPSSQSFAYSIKSASFSAGVPATIGLGYMVSDHVGIQLDASIGLSNKKYTFVDNNVNLGTAASPVPGTISTTQTANHPVLLIPALVIQSGGEKLKVYGRIGAVLPLNTKVTQEMVLSNLPGAGAVIVDDFTWQIKSSFSVGFTAAAGVKYQLNDKMSIWGEFSFLSMTQNTKEQNLQTWTEDGQSVSLSAYPYPTHIKFSKTAIVDTTFETFPTYGQPFSNVGFNVGISFNISEKKARGNKHFTSDEGEENKKPFKRR